jgi:hypothetical protein
MKHALQLLLIFPIWLASGSQVVCGQVSQPAAPSLLKRLALAPAQLRVGMGLGLSGGGDYPALKSHLEYAPQIGKRWRLASRLAYIAGSEHKRFGKYGTTPRSYRALNAEQELHWLPFGVGRTVEFGVGGGLVAGYVRVTDVSFVSLNEDLSGNTTLSYLPRQRQGLLTGGIVSMYADVALNPAATWRLGGRLALQTGANTHLMPGGQIQLSRTWQAR